MNPYLSYATQFRNLLENRDRVLLTITRDPDGDSVGSMLAMAHAMQHLGKEVTCYSPDVVPEMFSFMAKPGMIMRDLERSVHDFHVVIIFDAGDVKRTPLVAELARRQLGKTLVINIDHHPTVTSWEGQSVVDHNIIETSAGATTEMLHHLFEALHIPLTPHAATCLLAGILTDTSHFTNHGTSLHSLNVAAKLTAQGGQHHVITQATMRNKSLGTLQLWGRALTRLQMNQEGVVTTVLTLQDFQECGVDPDAGSGISNFLNGLKEGTMAMVLHELPGGKVKGSLRTTRHDVNVADFAEKFGGGGHAKAAGFVIPGQLEQTPEGWQIVPLAKNATA